MINIKCTCGADMEPVWFIEKEMKKTVYGSLYATGRKRRAVSHFECPECFRKETVDDSFDGDWY